MLVVCFKAAAFAFYVGGRTRQSAFPGKSCASKLCNLCVEASYYKQVMFISGAAIIVLPICDHSLLVGVKFGM